MSDSTEAGPVDVGWFRILLVSNACLALAFFYPFGSFGFVGAPAVVIDVLAVLTMGVLAFYSMYLVGSVVQEEGPRRD